MDEAPLRLGVRATAPFKPRGRIPSSSGGNRNPGRGDPPRGGLPNVWMAVALLAMIVACALAVVLLMKSGKQPPPPRKPAALPPGTERTAPGPSAAPSPDRPFAVSLKRDPSSGDPRVADGLSVLEACLLNRGIAQRPARSSVISRDQAERYPAAPFGVAVAGVPSGVPLG